MKFVLCDCDVTVRNIRFLWEKTVSWTMVSSAAVTTNGGASVHVWVVKSMGRTDTLDRAGYLLKVIKYTVKVRWPLQKEPIMAREVS